MSLVRPKIVGGYAVTFTVGSAIPGSPTQSFKSTVVELYFPEQSVDYNAARRGGSFEFTLKGEKSGGQEVFGAI